MTRQNLKTRRKTTSAEEDEGGALLAIEEDAVGVVAEADQGVSKDHSSTLRFHLLVHLPLAQRNVSKL